MTTKKLQSIFKFYDDWLCHRQRRCFGGRELQACCEERDPVSDEHLLYMCRRAVEELIPAGRIEKAMRWLGYVQGVMVARELFSLVDIKFHSHSEQ